MKIIPLCAVLALLHYEGCFASMVPGYGNKAEGSSDILTNHGGPVMKKPVAYVIYYGNWPTASKTIVENFLTGLGSTSWWAINKNYFGAGSKVGVGPLVYNNQSTSDNYSQGTNLSDTWAVVQAALTAKKILDDSVNGIYLVLSSSDVTQTNLCGAPPSGFCGWHDNKLFNNKYYKFAFIAVPPYGCPCYPQEDASPNGNPGVDALINVLAHELAETATDPLGDGWWSSPFYYENADKCNFDFPPSFINKTVNGAKYNINFGGNNYYIQTNWDLGSKTCSMTPSTVVTTSSTIGQTTPNTTPSTAGNVILLAGGMNSLGNYLNQVEVFSPLGGCQQKLPSLPIPLGGAPSVLYQGKINVCGGENYVAPYLNRVCYQLNQATGTWVTASSFNNFHYRKPGQSYNGKFYLLNDYNQNEVLDLKSNTWSSFPGKPLDNGDLSCMVVWKDSLMVFGGAPGIQQNGVQAFNFTTQTWKSLNNMPIPRWGASCIVLFNNPNKILHLGSETIYNIAHIYDAVADSWSQSTSSQYGHWQSSFVALGKRIFVAGGLDASGNTNMVEEYHESTDSWTTAAYKISQPKRMFYSIAVPAFLFSNLTDGCIGV